MTKTFTYLQMEAALCIWEWINECSCNDDTSQYADLREHRKACGTAALRHTSIDLADYCLSVYDLLPPEARDGFAYDWEIIPAILDTVDWSVSPPAKMVAADAARVVTRALTSQTQKKRPA